MLINNIKKYTQYLTITEDDVIIVYIVKLVKDEKSTWNWSTPERLDEDGVLIKYYPVYDIDTLYRYFTEIVKICDSCNARAYITVSPRSKTKIEAKIQSLISNNYDFSNYCSFVYNEIVNDDTLIENQSYIIEFSKDIDTYEVGNGIVNILVDQADDKNNTGIIVKLYDDIDSLKYVVSGNVKRELFKNKISEVFPAAKFNTSNCVILYVNSK